MDLLTRLTFYKLHLQQLEPLAAAIRQNTDNSTHEKHTPTSLITPSTVISTETAYNDMKDNKTLCRDEGKYNFNNSLWVAHHKPHLSNYTQLIDKPGIKDHQ